MTPSAPAAHMPGSVSRDEMPPADVLSVAEISGYGGAGSSSTACPATGGRSEISPSRVLGTLPGSGQHAQLVRQWPDDVVFFVRTCAKPAVMTTCGAISPGMPDLVGRMVRSKEPTPIPMSP